MKRSFNFSKKHSTTQLLLAIYSVVFCVCFVPLKREANGNVKRKSREKERKTRRKKSEEYKNKVDLENVQSLCCVVC